MGGILKIKSYDSNDLWYITQPSWNDVTFRNILWRHYCELWKYLEWKLTSAVCVHSSQPTATEFSYISSMDVNDSLSFPCYGLNLSSIVMCPNGWIFVNETDYFGDLLMLYLAPVAHDISQTNMKCLKNYWMICQVLSPQDELFM